MTKQPQTQNAQKKSGKITTKTKKHNEFKNMWNERSCSQMYRLRSDYIIKRTLTPKQSEHLNSKAKRITVIHPRTKWTNWKLTSVCAQAKNHIWPAWHRFHHRPRRKHGDNLDEKSISAANSSKSSSRDKVAFCPIKYLHSGVLPITCPNTCVIKSDPCTVVINIHLICFKAQKQSCFTEDNTYSHIQAI